MNFATGSKTSKISTFTNNDQEVEDVVEDLDNSSPSASDQEINLGLESDDDGYNSCSLFNVYNQGFLMKVMPSYRYLNTSTK
jgi:hypothetical protein